MTTWAAVTDASTVSYSSSIVEDGYMAGGYVIGGYIVAVGQWTAVGDVSTAVWVTA